MNSCQNIEGWGPWSAVRPFDFTVCFGLLVGVIPFGLLLLGLPRMIHLCCSKPLPFTVSLTYALKLGGSLLLALLSGLDFVISMDKPLLHQSIASGIAVIGYTLASILHHFEQSRARSSSSILLLFWLASVIVHSILLRSLYLQNGHVDHLFDFVVTASSIGLSLLVFIVELMPRQHDYQDLDEPLSPEEEANIFSRLSFHWMDPLMKLGFKRDLEMEDLWTLKKQDTATNCSEVFQKEWNAQLNRPKPSLLMAVVKSFGPLFFSGAIYKAGQDILGFTQPQLLKKMMSFASSYAANSPVAPEPLSRGWAIAFTMLSAALLQTILLHQYFHACLVSGMRLKSAIVTAVYRKSMRLSNSARQGSTVGEITNLMSVDAGRVSDLCTYLHIVWSAQLQIGLAIYFLYDTLGVAIFGGVVIMILMIPINAYLATKSRGFNKSQMVNKDGRTRLMDELLSGIKVIKLYAWEMPFLKRIGDIRERELSTLKSIGYLSAVQTFTWSCTPFLVSLTSFSIYSFLNTDPLTSTKVFVCLSLFNLLQFPLTMLPNVITAVVEASVSFSRLYSFLLNEELDLNAVKYDIPQETPGLPIERVSVRGGTFKWDPTGEPVVSNISFKVSDGELLAIVGSVGAGKSSLLSALLGETYRVDGSVTVKGTLAYVPQNAWIMNDTLRENILFGKPFDPVLYEKTIEACGLKPDLEILPGGDMIEIGERGINLSGGQKQRVSLSRAVYSQADIYLFDDPLSAVDAHVGRSIFDQVFSKNGLLKNKARIFVTHGIHFLPETTRIMVLTNGKVSETGQYQDLLARRGAFSNLIKEYGKRRDDPESSSPVSVENSDPLLKSTSAVKLLNKSVSGISVDSKKDKAETPNGTNLIAKEESAKGSVSWTVYSAYAKACGNSSVFVFMAMCVVSQSLSVFQNVFLSWWANANDEAKHYVARTMSLMAVDSVPKSISGPHSATWWLLIYGAIGLASSLAVVSQVIFVWVLCGIRASRRLHEEMLNNVVHLPQSFFDTTPLGRVMNRFSKDMYTVDEVLPRSFQGYFRTLFIVMSVLGVNAMGSPLYIAFAIPLAMLYSYFQRYYLRSSRALKRLDSTSRSPLYAHFQESLNGVSTIRAYRRDAQFIGTNMERLDFNQRAYFPSVASNRWLAVRLEFIGALIVFGSASSGVLSIYWKSDIPASVIGLMLTYSLTVTQTLNWMVRQSCEIETNIVSVERLSEYIQLPKEAPYLIPDRPINPDWPMNGKITFDNYSTRYRQGLDLVLRNLSVRVDPKERIGIVGRTGAGKSSLTLSLFRLIEPSSGSVFIDDVDISRLGLYDLRSRLTIIPQDPVLFSGTIRYNLDPFEKHTDDQLWNALECASLKSHVARLEGTLDHLVLQNGENFSVGQRALICLARAVLRKTNILVLDEATASVDVETDDIIQKAIRQEFKDCTILTIAHRINTVMDSDRILVLDQGRVAEFDSPQNLLRNKRSKFYSLAKEAGQAS